MKKEDFVQNLFYGILLSAFMVLYFILSMNSRPVADDFYFLKNLEEHGWLNSMLLSYHSWITRWASILWLNAIFTLYRFTGSFLFFHIITLLVLCFALYRFSVFSLGFFMRSGRNAMKWNGMSDLPRHSRFTVSLLISFFVFTTGIGETFFWATSSAMYLWAFIAACFLLAEVMREKQTVVSTIICITTAVYVGGAAEAISLPVSLILIAMFIYQWRNKKFLPLTIVSVIFLLASIGISYAGEGRVLRQSALPDLTFGESIGVSIRSLVQIDLYFLREKYLFVILFFLAWMGFGSQLSLAMKPGFKMIAALTGAYLILYFIFVFPTCFLLGEIPPHRARILVGFLNSCMLSNTGVIAGSYFPKNIFAKFISSLSVLVLVVMIGMMSIEQKQITSAYAASVDKRMHLIKKNIELGDYAPIALDPLPDAGLLLSSEISSDTADFRNQHLKNYLRTTNDIFLNK